MTAGNKRVVLLVALLVVLVAGVVEVFLYRDVPVSNKAWPSLPYQSEDQWIVSQTAIAVVDLAQFARTGKPSPPATLAISHMETINEPALAFKLGARDVSISL